MTRLLEQLAALKPHKTATSDAAWNGPSVESSIPSDATETQLRGMYAWVDPNADPATKAAYKFIHHAWDGGPGAANIRACTTGIGVLNGGRGGTTIPASDKRGVWDHLAKHIRDSGGEPPELKHAASPLEARRSHAQALRGVQEIRFCKGVELRGSSSGALTLEGYASVFNVPYDRGFYTETVYPGAFRKTLSENADVQLLINHEGLPLARTRSGNLALSEDETGLHVDASLDAEDPDVINLKRKMDRGDLDEMSIAFWTKRQSWNDEYTERGLLELSLDKGDVSVVNYGANPATAGATLRGLAQQRGLNPQGYLDALRELRQGKTLSADTMSALQNVLDLIAGADESLDDAQQQLADLMGVPNPDPEGASLSGLAQLEMRLSALTI